MKKLLSLILCVALLMGICASAFAEKNLQGLMKDNDALKIKLGVMRSYIIYSGLCMDGFSNDFEEEYHADSELALIGLSLYLVASNREIDAILRKQDISLEDYKKGVSIFQYGVDLLPSVRKYVVGSDEYNKYSATLSEKEKSGFKAACDHGASLTTSAVQYLNEVKKMIADGQKQPLDLITNIPKSR